MKQENNKVREELEAGVEHITTLQVDVEKTLRKLDQEFDVSGSQPQLTNSAKVLAALEAAHPTEQEKLPMDKFIFLIPNQTKQAKKLSVKSAIAVSSFLLSSE
ncbi:hypothetical protein HAX54_004758 [Datura stramonium]|uniref:NET2A-D/KIP1-like C-terminal domain-containing protein n=1 Tax=Datura stramonium TaxID=4076 RepID=A0ABS8T7H6_DATST|nr:hypothetical protein [Datura stramonium]